MRVMCLIEGQGVDGHVGDKSSAKRNAFVSVFEYVSRSLSSLLSLLSLVLSCLLLSYDVMSCIFSFIFPSLSFSVSVSCCMCWCVVCSCCVAVCRGLLCYRAVLLCVVDESVGVRCVVWCVCGVCGGSTLHEISLRRAGVEQL